jgi:hypothetical protein
MLSYDEPPMTTPNKPLLINAASCPLCARRMAFLNTRGIHLRPKAENTHISQDGGKYWEIRLILNLQI